jgi:GrpB-like predicted nucleotidyltransferase (UPF0157 family)
MSDVFFISDLGCTVAFREEKEKIMALLRALLPSNDVFEIGSTALEGMIGKCDLDFAVRVKPEDFENIRELLDGLFQRNSRQLSNEKFQGYLYPSPIDVSLQLFIEGSEYDDFDLFLEILRCNSEVYQAYKALKMAWHGRSMAGYLEAKNAFILKAFSLWPNPD